MVIFADDLLQAEDRAENTIENIIDLQGKAPFSVSLDLMDAAPIELKDEDALSPSLHEEEAAHRTDENYTCKHCGQKGGH